MRKFNTIGETLKTSRLAKSFGVWTAVFCAFAGGATAAVVTVERIIAKVNDEIIMLSELQDFVKPRVEELRKNYAGEALNSRIRELELAALDAMVEKKLILKRAGVIGAKVDEKEIEGGVTRILQENNITTARLRDILSAQGTTFEKYREDIRERILARKVERAEVGLRVRVGEQEVADYYNAHEDDYREGESRVVRQIFFPLAEGASAPEVEAQRKKATRAYEEAARPDADFARVAAKRSQGPSKGRGGLLGSLKRGEVFPELEQLVFSAEEGKISKPTRTRVGYHVVRVEKVNPGKTISLDRLAGKIRDKLYAEKFVKRRREWMADLKRSAFLEISYDPKTLGSGLASISRNVREQVTFRLVGVQLNGSRGVFGRSSILWAYGSNQRETRWKSDKLSVGAQSRLDKDAIGALAPGQRLFVNPDPSANLYLFEHRYLFPDSYIGKVNFADVIKAFSLQSRDRGGGEKIVKIDFDTDTKSARLEFEVEVDMMRSIVADPKRISQ